MWGSLRSIHPPINDSSTDGVPRGCGNPDPPETGQSWRCGSTSLPRSLGPPNDPCARSRATFPYSRRWGYQKASQLSVDEAQRDSRHTLVSRVRTHMNRFLVNHGLPQANQPYAEAASGDKSRIPAKILRRTKLTLLFRKPASVTAVSVHFCEGRLLWPLLDQLV